MTHNTTCHTCNHEFKVEIEPYIPARTHGLPEDCYPAEGGTVEPNYCPHCDAKLPADKIYKEWEDARRDHISDYRD
jgi:hypothetical protein